MRLSVKTILRTPSAISLQKLIAMGSPMSHFDQNGSYSRNGNAISALISFSTMFERTCDTPGSLKMKSSRNARTPRSRFRDIYRSTIYTQSAAECWISLFCSLFPVFVGIPIGFRQSPVFRIELRHRLGIVYESASGYVLNVRSATNIGEGVRRQYEEICDFTGLRPCL